MQRRLRHGLPRLVPFDEPILYDEPVEYAPNVHAIGAIWAKGIGFVHPPLSGGSHTLELLVYIDTFQIGFHNTWDITVHPGVKHGAALSVH